MIEPILDNLLLESIETKANESGIIRPETAKEKPEIGLLLAHGPKCEVSYSTKGKVVYKKWAANEIKYEGKTYILVAEKDVLGVIK